MSRANRSFFNISKGWNENSSTATVVFRPHNAVVNFPYSSEDAEDAAYFHARKDDEPGSDLRDLLKKFGVE